MPISSVISSFPARLSIKSEHISQGLGIVLGTCFSPTWLLLKWVLSLYLPHCQWLHQGTSVAAALDLLRQLDALRPAVLVGQVIPLLILCQLIALAYLYLCGIMSKTAIRYLCKSQQQAD